MNMLIFYAITIAIAFIIYHAVILAVNISFRIKVNKLLENIDDLEDIQYINFKILLYITAEMFRRKGYSVKITDKCGEEGSGLLLDDTRFVEIWRRALYREVECEVAMKLARCMQSNSIYRGVLITLGDFKRNTRIYCHKNVIECITGQQLLSMLKEVQKRKALVKMPSRV